MNAVGIICEYNPFHNGHLYHLKKVKEIFPNDVIVLIMSGMFTQRGEPSLISKWDKTEIALQHGIDLVIELPFPFATQNADVFAKGAISLLKELKVTSLVFGSESNDVNQLIKLASIQLENPDYDYLVKEYLMEGKNYPTATSLALKSITNQEVNLPNDILGLSYVKEILRQNASIKPITIQRTNDYHCLILENNITSASSIRRALREKKEIHPYIPENTIGYYQNKLHFQEDYFSFLKYKIYSSWNELDKYQGVDEGIESRIKKAILTARSYQEFVFAIKTKRYTFQRIQRMLTHILCDFTKEEAKKMNSISYIRVLGFNNKGQDYLHQIKKKVTLPILTNISKNTDSILKKEQQATAIYYLMDSKTEQTNLISQEYQRPPIRFLKKE